MNLAELADRIEIRELAARYNNAIDDGQLDEFLELFTDDAVFEVAGSPPAKGKAEIAALISAFPTGHIHATTDAVVRVDGDLATQRCTLICLGRRRDRGEQSVIATGRYADDFVRTASGWKFTKRLAALDVDLTAMVELLSRL
jgi:uncharacterized protein (TIGR02246 family)